MITSYVKFTPSEIKVLKGISEGLCNEEIAQRYYLSIYTVRGYLMRVYSKLGLTYKGSGQANRVKAALFYLNKYGPKGEEVYIKENEAHKKGYDDGIKAVLKRASALLEEDNKDADSEHL